jgi:hypothetical protein
MPIIPTIGGGSDQEDNGQGLSKTLEKHHFNNNNEKNSAWLCMHVITVTWKA